MRLEYEKALKRVLACRCLAAVYHACFWFAAAFLPSNFLLQVRLWLDPNHLPYSSPSSEAAHVCVSPHGSRDSATRQIPVTLVTRHVPTWETTTGVLSSL